MSREWKPGDVAMVSMTHGSLVKTYGPCLYDGVNSEWVSGDQGRLYPSEGGWQISDVRPLVVIDPTEVFGGLSESASARIAKFLREIITWQGPRISGGNDHLGRLADYFEPAPPPKPEEPTGLGAVVEDAGGNPWVRWTPGEGAVWLGGDRRTTYSYIYINAVKVLSPGWSE